MHYWWVGLGNVIGSTILAYYWDDFAPALATDWDKINLLKTFGPMGGLLVTYLLLFAALMLIIGWENASSAVRHRRLLRRSHENIVPDYRLDMVGEPCPYPAVATLRRCRS